MKSKKILIFILSICCSSNMMAQHVLTIDKALEIARENSPDLKTSYLNLLKYRQILIAQQASMKSQFSLSLSPISYSKNRKFDNRLSQWYTNENFSTNGTLKIQQPIPWTDGTVSLINKFGWQNNNSTVSDIENNNKSFTNDLYLQFTQPLFTYNTQKMEMQDIKYDYENANISYALQKLETEKQISTQFYNVYMAQSKLEISEVEYKNASDNYGIIKSKVDADLAAKEELFQAEINLSSAESSLEEKKVTLENAKDNLKKSLGIPLNEDLQVTSTIITNKVNISLEKAIQHGLDSRLELRQREITTKQLEEQLIKTRALNEFKGDLSLSIGVTGNHRDFSNIYDTPTTSPAIALTFSVPIFDWGEKKARIAAQQKSIEINEVQGKSELIDIELNIREVARNLENLSRQIDIAKQSVKNAQYTYDLNLIKYRQGDLSGMDMNQYQTQLSNKKISYSQALINYKLELLNLKILSLYDFEKNEAIVPIQDLDNLDKKYNSHEK